MQARRWAMLVLAVLLLGAAAAQALGGWPHFRATLLHAGVPAETVAAVGAGWLFASALLLGLSGLCIAAGLRHDGRVGSASLALAVAVVFTGFGALGWWLRGHSHYATFLALGLAAAVVAAIAAWPRLSR